MQYHLVLKRTQAIDVAIWCALGHSRVAQRTTAICAIVLLRMNASSISGQLVSENSRAGGDF